MDASSSKLTMNWYCVNSKTKRESSVGAFLEGSYGLEVLCPQFETLKVIRRVKRKVTMPLFPGYLFCRFDLATHYRAVRFAHDALGRLAAWTDGASNTWTYAHNARGQITSVTNPEGGVATYNLS